MARRPGIKELRRRHQEALTLWGRAQNTQWIARGNMVKSLDKDVSDPACCSPAVYGQEELSPGYEIECANARLIAAIPHIVLLADALMKEVEDLRYKLRELRRQ